MPTSAKTCGSCGAQGQNGAFCDECGETLPEETTVAAEPSRESAPLTEPAPAVEPAPPAGTTLPTVPLAAAEAHPYPPAAPAFTPAPAPTLPYTEEPATRLDAFQPIPPAGDRSGRSAPPAASDPPAGEQPAPGPKTEPNEQARALIVPVEEPSQKTSPVAPVLPGRPAPAPPPTVQRQEAEITDGGQPCPWCGTPNPVGRHFCRRCAMSMEKHGEEAGPVRRPWWRRMVDWQNRPIPFAGQRPRLRRGPGQLVRLLITLLIVILLIVMAAIFGGSAVEAIEDHFAKPQLISMGTPTTNVAGRSHPPSNLTDRYNNTWWGTGGTQGGTWVDIKPLSPSPAHVLDAIVTPGAGADQQDFTSQDNPKSLTLVMTSTGGKQTTKELKLSGAAGAQVFPMDVKNVTKVHVIVGAANPGGGGDQQIAIAGLEFFGK